MEYYFYLARCADNSLYAGFCHDIAAREQKHNEGNGARYTRSRLPVRIVYFESFPTASEARRREALVKRWRKNQKELLVRTGAGSKI